MFNVPQSSASHEYFTASGSGANPARAEKEAEANLLTEVMRWIGVSIKTNTTSASFGTINDLDKFIEKEITENAAAEIKNLKIKSRHIEKSASITTVYLLAEYDKKELEKEKRRLLKLAEERADSVSRPHKKGDEFYDEKKYFKAFEQYSEAACSALKFGIDNGEIKFKENIEAAKQSLKNIKIEALCESYIAGGTGSASVTARVQTEPEMPLTVTYSLQAVNGKRVSKKIIIEKITADENGFAEFRLPEKTSAGEGFIIFAADITAVQNNLAALKNTSAVYERSALIEHVKQGQVFFTYGIKEAMPAKRLSNEDAPDKGKTDSAESVDKGGLTKNKRKTVGVFLEEYVRVPYGLRKTEAEDFFAETLRGLHFDTKIIKTQADFAEHFIVHAKVKTEEAEKTDSGFFVKLFASIKIYDTKSGAVIYSKEFSKRGAGFSLEKAEQAAIREIVKQAASGIR